MNVIALLCLIGGVQGIFLSIHFGIRKNGRPVLNRLVSVMLAVYSLNLLNTYTFLAGYPALHNFLQPISNYLGWWVGPSLWFYVRYPAIPQDWPKALFLHYSPIIPIAVVGTLWPTTLPYLGGIYYLQFSSYLAATLYYIIKGEVDRKLLSWVIPLIYAMALIKLANIIMVGLELTGASAIPDTVRISFILLAAFPIFLIAYREMNASQTFMPEPTKYGRSGMGTDEMRDYLDDIKKVVEEQELYLNPNLTLADVAAATGIQKRRISQVINQSLDKNFSTFINEYRLSAVTQKLADPQCSHLSILGIAEECGFNSGGRFNTLFKKRYSTTPSQYRTNALQSP